MSRKNKNKASYKAKRAAKAARKTRTLFTIEGIVQMTREGYCFVRPTEDSIQNFPQTMFSHQNPDQVQGRDVFVKATRTRGALNGDKVAVDVVKIAHSSHGGKKDSTSGAGRCEGVVTAIIERSVKPFVGYLHIVGDQAWVLMQSKVMPYDISLDEVPKGAKQGFKVAAVVDDWPRGENNPKGHIVDVLGAPGENDTEMHAILAEFGLPYRFEPFIDKAAEKISEEITPSDIKERKDFRNTLTFTVDPSDAKDFDDALSYKLLKNGNMEVGVHIADVTHYITPGTVIDKEAMERGTSVYLVDRTVPMLPEKLCNRLCSLRPGEDKLCFSVVFEFDADGKIVGHWMGRTIIRSDYRFDYEAAQTIIKKDKAETDVETAVKALWTKAEALRAERFKQGAVSFERPEMKVICDEKGRPLDVVEKYSFEANWMIEEFMLLANRTVAEYVAVDCKDKTFVYRIHDEPNQEKLSVFRTFVRNFGYKLPEDLGGRKAAFALNGLLGKVKDAPEASAIELMGLRCMAKARYDVENIGHYGLAFKYYTHFTSPIRRYPDMMVHRLLARYLDKGDSADKEYYAQQCVHASEREQVAADAERASVKYKMVEFLQDKMGMTFSGTVSGLTEWGMYVQIEPTHIEGMVALRDIKSDFFIFDEEHYRLVGRHSRKTYTMGDPVRIKLIRTDLETKQIDFELLEG